jgi:hypothetical protein
MKVGQFFLVISVEIFVKKFKNEKLIQILRFPCLISRDQTFGCMTIPTVFHGAADFGYL